MGNALIGDSRFDIDTLSLSIKNVQLKIRENEAALADAEFALNKKQGAMSIMISLQAGQMSSIKHTGVKENDCLSANQ